MPEAAKNFTGSIISLLKDVCKNVNITINDVSDLDICFKLVAFKETEIINGLEIYTSTNSSLVPFSVQWKHFIHPSNLSIYESISQWL